MGRARETLALPTFILVQPGFPLELFDKHIGLQGSTLVRILQARELLGEWVINRSASEGFDNTGIEQHHVGQFCRQEDLNLV